MCGIAGFHGNVDTGVPARLVRDDPLRARYVMIPVTIPKGVIIERVSVETLPADWSELAARDQLQAIGTAWAKQLTSAVLAVPSTVIPAETNYLLNPLHSAFARIEIGEPQIFLTDLRLIKK